ncbi:hypothetical protein GRI44_12745 [Altererythrobacter confluentis]|uniref:Lipoprotein n=1 Tax=Allopontixanthobacter confluentis TaxID=1849021 RepID=A0A6L7GL60_9SPHN|nr:hypothetical protein [Allopontixanthobacter confluentis]MXP15618.1 hypothetical protein [Allopontixanthobacter confluentis]
MKKFAIALVLPALVALAACADNDAAGETDAMATTGEAATTAAPMGGDSAVAADATAGQAATDTVSGNAATGDRVTIDANGVNADITDGNTRVQANVDGKPSLTVETD